MNCQNVGDVCIFNPFVATGFLLQQQKVLMDGANLGKNTLIIAEEVLSRRKVCSRKPDDRVKISLFTVYYIREFGFYYL